MKSLKITSGNYKIEYKGYIINIIHTADIAKYDCWYFTYTDPIGNFNEAQDVYSTKRYTIGCAIEWIEYLTR